ncbi:MAG: hypothetical protein ACREQN_14595 [Candidatus Binataceae bacterium]
MAARKSGSPVRETRGVDAAKSSQIKQLRATVHEFRIRLQHEARQRRLDLRLLAEAKRTRTRITREMTALREQERRLAKQLRKALGESGREERTRRRAQARVVELRAALKRKTEELRRKSIAAAKAAAACAEAAAMNEHEMAPSASAIETPASSAMETSTVTGAGDESPGRERLPQV